MPQDLIKIKSQEHIPKYIIPYEIQACLLEAKEGCGYRPTRRKDMNVSKRGYYMTGMGDPETGEVKIIFIITHNVIIALTREGCLRHEFFSQGFKLKIHQELHA